MKKGRLGKSSLLAVIGVLTIAVSSSIWAYFSAEMAVENQFITRGFGSDKMIEKFTPNDNWELGAVATKEAFVENTGTTKLFVRVKLEERWARDDVDFITLDSKSGNDKLTNAHFLAGSGQIDNQDGTTTGDGSVVKKTLGSDKWVYSELDGYWYYNEILQPASEAGSKTELFLKSIMLSVDTDMGILEESKEYALAYTRSVSNIKSGFAGYSDADYSLFIIYETYQATPEARAEAVSSAGGNWDGTKTPNLN